MKHVSLYLLLWILSTTVQAQPPCADGYKKGLRKNEQFIAPCDSMVVLSKAAFEKLHFQLAKLGTEVNLYKQETESLTKSMAHRDSLVQVYQKEVREFEQYLKATEKPIADLQTNLKKSIENTDKVISIARKNKTLGIIAGGLGGILIGVLVGAVAF